jgi:hypothetical protein
MQQVCYTLAHILGDTRDTFRTQVGTLRREFSPKITSDPVSDDDKLYASRHKYTPACSAGGRQTKGHVMSLRGGSSWVQNILNLASWKLGPRDETCNINNNNNDRKQNEALNHDNGGAASSLGVDEGGASHEKGLRGGAFP